MKKITVETGFGYFEQGGKITVKAELPVGEHECPDDVNYVEVGSQAELDVIEVYQDPVKIDKANNEKKIAGRIRKLAIDDLKAKGELPTDYE